jgi:hypothetical protein
MPLIGPRSRRQWCAVSAAAAFVAILAAMGPAAGPAAAATPPATLPVTPSAVRSHKVIFPTLSAWQSLKHLSLKTTTPAAGTDGTGPLYYGGGVDGISVTTGPPRVYLVFWGSQWGSASTSGGITTLSNDAEGTAPVLQRLFQGLGTNNETWSGVMTQYCEGIDSGASACPASAAHVGYPTGGALAGVWADTSTSAPEPADGHQIAREAVAAAGHFGNTTAASNRNAQYVIMSPSGTHPDGFNAGGGFCAWHDYTGDTTLSGGAATSSYGNVAFTNLPYVTDMAANCGQNYVNDDPVGQLDGVTIVAGHEYAETITDQNPAGGWIDSSGFENADKCAWVGVGGAGGAQAITFATGSFAMQATWSNDDSGCAISHPIVP